MTLSSSPVEPAAPRSTLMVLLDIRGHAARSTRSRTATVHAQGLLGELLTAARSPLARGLACVREDSDSLFFVTPLDGEGWTKRRQVILDGLEAAICAFEDGVGRHLHANTCPCEACVAAGRLRLRLIVHAGAALLRGQGERLEATGAEVVLAHRLRDGDSLRETHLVITDAGRKALGMSASEAYEPVAFDAGVDGWIRLVERDEIPSGGAAAYARLGHILKKALWDFRYKR